MILISAVLITNDGGPILYSQVRTGLYGKQFKIWKLRSMCIDAEHDGAQYYREVIHVLQKLAQSLDLLV